MHSVSVPVVAVGPHTENITVPDGAPPLLLPLTVAVSDTDEVEEPSTIDVGEAFVDTVGVAGVTVKHSFVSILPLTLSDAPV